MWHSAAGEKARPMWPTCFGGGFATTREAVHQVPRARCELFLFLGFLGGLALDCLSRLVRRWRPAGDCVHHRSSRNRRLPRI